jgi:hypothetical protein
MARCPAHEDKQASLSVARGTEQPVVFKCHAGCERDAILDGLGLTLADVSAPREKQPDQGEWTPRGTAVNVYDYVDENSDLLFQVLRTADKQFPQRVPDRSKKSGWRWSLGTTRRVPYRLPAVIAAIAEKKTVYIVEGEKDVHAMERAGAVATTSPGGAGKWRPDYDAFFTGASVVIVADADEPGRKHAADIARHLRPLAADVLLAEPAYGKDASDHLAAGHGLDFISAAVTDTITFNVIDLEPAAVTVLPPVPICGDMLYTGAVHTLTGPPDCGKTTLACWWMLTVIREGRSVLFLDEEGGLEIVAEKFQALGARPGERLCYVPFPGSSWGHSDITMLAQLMAQRKPAIVMWDSSAAFLSRAGLDENSAQDVTQFYSQVLMPAARLHGAAVVAIDHDTKNSEPSRYARGSGAKLAATDVAYKIAPVAPFSKGQSGSARLTVTKDRRGWLSRAHEVTFVAGEILGITIREAGSGFGDNPLDLAPGQQKILTVLEGQPPSSWRQIQQLMADQGWRPLVRETISRYLDKLLELRLVDEIPQPYGASSLWMVTNGI